MSGNSQVTLGTLSSNFPRWRKGIQSFSQGKSSRLRRPSWDQGIFWSGWASQVPQARGLPTWGSTIWAGAQGLRHILQISLTVCSYSWTAARLKFFSYPFSEMVRELVGVYISGGWGWVGGHLIKLHRPQKQPQTLACNFIPKLVEEDFLDCLCSTLNLWQTLFHLAILPLLTGWSCQNVHIKCR